MIYLDTESYCEDCADFEPAVSKLCLSDERFDTVVSCENSLHCRAILRYLSEKWQKTDENAL